MTSEYYKTVNYETLWLESSLKEYADHYQENISVK